MPMNPSPEPVTAMPELDANQPLVDPARLRELAQMAGPAESAKLLQELLEMFRTESIPHVARLTAAWAGGDATLARSEAHYLAGSSANLGLSRLAAGLRELEAMAREGRLPAYADLAGLLDQWLGEACTAYEKARTELA
ncbi:MAG: Hpt domain-containing protein [Opitutales bacterium]|jgi:HPt (histidine-containing phosphotransfer) domain-containing protein